MTDPQIDFWNFILSAVSTFVVVSAALAGTIKYFQERQRDREVRREELSWRKTQFLLELADDFEEDERHEPAWQFLAYGIGLPKNSSLKKILGGNVNILTASELKLRYSIDNYLDFFDRLYHFTFITQSLNISDIEVFGWYIAQVGETKEIYEYAKNAGFEDVLKLNKELQKLFGKRHWYKTIRKHRTINKSKVTKS
ncbi:MAG TPA: hypothetical protein PLQ75_05850 [Anaerolineales bacterium]|nr:hypothetical protein [Saprospiraceae bacterium]HNE03028.1 hypothetical protein [Anaerolineales bacterium]HNF94152.1 hypothetical protein [Anaerolineales bacterium]